MNRISTDILKHYGVARRSGRYPYGSGKDPYQHSGDFLSRIEELKRDNVIYQDPRTGKIYKGDTAIAKTMGLSTTEFRAQRSIANAERRSLEVDTAKGLREKGLSYNEIAEKMGYPSESSIRSLLNTSSEARMTQAKKTADFLKQQIDEKGMIDIGKGVEKELNVSAEKLKEAVNMLELQGYEVYGGGVPQVTNPGKQTNIKVIGPPGTKHRDIYDFENIHSVTEYVSHDDGDTFDKYVYPKSMDSKRLQIKYAEDGGKESDGLIEIRRNVDDLSLGQSHYAQVRILVDDNKYLKGMAVYSDNLPDGVDIRFNTNKSKDVSKMDVLKNITNDPDNPFGSLIKAGGQSYYVDKNGNKQLSLINKRAEEGDWNDWTDKLSSQFLGKQNISLIKKQLDLTIADKKAEYDEIMSLTNPTVKKALLKSYSDDLDAEAVHLRAASLPRQKYQVILPIPNLNDNEVYAPNYKNGEQIALVRFPHAGPFEIPILTVNNKNQFAKKMIGSDSIDAIGINSKIAEQLSGADFDGDTVLAIPHNSRIQIKSTPPLKGLENFDARLEYGGKEEGTYKPMKNTGTEMGKISNLITDMQIKGASQDEITRAVKHSMVVIDAEKHRLDYKQSEIDNNISSLKKKYQYSVDDEGKISTGASTLLSKSKSPTQVLKTKGSPKINPETGELYSTPVVEEYIDRAGKTQIRTTTTTKMAATKDARTLSSGTPKEELYAGFANALKSMANQARKEIVSTGDIKYNSTAKATYQKEVDHLDAQLQVSLKNAPRERKAQLMANTMVNAQKKSNPDMTKAEIKKKGQQALTISRQQVGAKRTPISISNKEWDAIQAGAVSPNKLTQILTYADMDQVRQKATPRTNSLVSPSQKNRISAMQKNGYTLAEISEVIGVSTSTISKTLKT